MALRSVSAVTFTSPERGGQADVPDEGSQGIDAPEGKGVIVHVPALNAPDADSEADEFRETVLINAPVIGRMEHCEAGAVIAVHVRAYLMLHHVTHESVFLPSFTTRFSAMVASHMRLLLAV